MKDFRKGDIVVVTATVVGGDDDTLRITIAGTEVVVSSSDATLSIKSFHPGDPVRNGNEDAIIIQTIEPGVHLVHFEGRIGASAYQVVDENGLSHREVGETARQPEAAEERAHAPAPAPQADPAPVAGEASGQGDEGKPLETRFVFDAPGAEPKFTGRTERPASDGASDEIVHHDEHAENHAETAGGTLDLGGHELGDQAGKASIGEVAGEFAQELGDGGRSGAVDIDFDGLGVTEEFRPVSQRAKPEA